MSSRASLSEKEGNTLLIASHYMEYIQDKNKRAITWISLNEGNLNLCFTLSTSMFLAGCFEKKEATEPREFDPFFFTLKKSCFRRLALADVLRREERHKPESSNPFSFSPQKVYS